MGDEMASARRRDGRKPAPFAQDRRRRRWRTVLQWTPVAVIPAVIVGALILVTSPPLERDDSASVIRACQEAALQRLENPDTASFLNTSATGPGTWAVDGRVESTVDGEDVRIDFTCTVEVDDDRGTIITEVTDWRQAPR